MAIKYALVDSRNNMVADVIDKEFPVHPDLSFVEFNDTENDIKGGSYTWDGSKFEAIVVHPEKTYAQKRQLEYPEIGDQLDTLYHAGVFPEDMAAQLKAVKDKYPKE